MTLNPRDKRLGYLELDLVSQPTYCKLETSCHILERLEVVPLGLSKSS